MLSKTKKISLCVLFAGGMAVVAAGAIYLNEGSATRKVINAGNGDGDVAASGLKPGNSIYLTPTGNWTGDSAKFGYYFFDNNSHTAFSDIMTQVDGNPDENKPYQTIVPTVTGVEAWTTVVAIRLNSTATSVSFESGVKWNQTVNITLTGTQNGVTIGSGSGDTYPGTAYLYNPPDRANLYGKQFMSATSAGCTSHDVTTATWDAQKTLYNVMGADAKSWFKNVVADATETASDRAQGAARYDMIKGLYSYENFANR